MPSGSTAGLGRVRAAPGYHIAMQDRGEGPGCRGVPGGFGRYLGGMQLPVQSVLGPALSRTGRSWPSGLTWQGFGAVCSPATLGILSLHQTPGDKGREAAPENSALMADISDTPIARPHLVSSVSAAPGGWAPAVGMAPFPAGDRASVGGTGAVWGTSLSELRQISRALQLPQPF